MPPADTDTDTAERTETANDPYSGHELLKAIGYVLGVSYPVLAVSTGARAGYELLFKEGVTNYVGPSLSAVAALCYLLAAIGFFKRSRWAWKLSVGALAIETVMVVTVGTLSLLIPDTIGPTAWGRFGIDYGFFPFFQPILGLIWLTRGDTRQLYGFDADAAAHLEADAAST